MDKCKWVDDQFKGCKRLRETKITITNIASGFNSNIFYCPFCGELLKEPKETMPERIDIGNLDKVDDYKISIKSAHDRIDYILSKIEKKEKRYEWISTDSDYFDDTCLKCAGKIRCSPFLKKLGVDPYTCRNGYYIEVVE